MELVNRGLGWKLDHPQLIRARESGDQEQIARVLAELRLPNGKLDTSGYEIVSRVETPNLIVNEGRLAALDLITGTLSNTGIAWYFAPFQSDSTPTADWDGDFGAASGGDVTEFTGYDEATRQECVFDAAAMLGSRGSVTNSTRAQITVSTGVTQTIYGIGLTNNSTKQYSSGAAVLLGALRYSVPETVTAGQVFVMGYELYI